MLISYLIYRNYVQHSPGKFTRGKTHELMKSPNDVREVATVKSAQALSGGGACKYLARGGAYPSVLDPFGRPLSETPGNHLAEAMEAHRSWLIILDRKTVPDPSCMEGILIGEESSIVNKAVHSRQYIFGSGSVQRRR